MITRRKDGTYIVAHNGMPYHVVSREIDPANAYDIEEVRAYAEAHPEEVQDEDAESPIRLARINELTTYLTSTDWYVIRQQETGKAVPEEILAQREAARIEISELRDGLTTVEA